MADLQAEELRLFFIDPSWGEFGASPVEIGATNFSASFDSTYVDASSLTSTGAISPLLKPTEKGGSIDLTIPLTTQNFEFVNDMRNQSAAPSTNPSIFQAGIIYKGIVFRKMSYSIIEDALIVARISFDFNDFDLAYALVSTTPDVYIDRFESSGTLYDLSAAENLTSTDGTLNVKTSSLVLTDTYEEEEKNTKKITSQIIDSIDIDFDTEYKVIKTIGNFLPRKLIKTKEEIAATVKFPLLGEQSQIDYLHTFDGHIDSSNPLSDSKFKLSLLFKDVDSNAVDTTISLNANLISAQSQTNSFDVPQGSISVKQKIK